MFPVILNLAQLILAFRNPDFLSGAYVLLVNNYVTIIGVLLATIWSAGTKPQARTSIDDTGGVATQSPRFAPTIVSEDVDHVELSTPSAADARPSDIHQTQDHSE